MYSKIMRKLISHPSCAIDICRKMISRYSKCCPKCGVVGTFETHHTDQRGVRTYLCHSCRKTFSELYGTIFFRSKVPLDKWLLLIIYWINSTGSISAAEGARHIGVSHLSTWRMLMKLRKAFSGMISKDLLQGLVEADEAWFGRKKNQDIIMGIVERTNSSLRKLRLFVVPNVKERTLCAHVEREVQQGSEFFTDCRISYVSLGIRYQHQTVNHSKAEFARGKAHSNTIEQIWGWIKGIIRTIHHGISKKYRELYLAQFIFRYENEHASHLFNHALCQLFRPTYCLI